MKKLCLFSLCLMCLLGCNTEPTSVVKRTDLYYQLIRTFVTDSVVLPLFTEDQLVKLRNVEKIYLAASESIKNADDQTPALYVIIECAEEVCGVLDSLEGIPEKYRKELLVIKVAIIALRLGLTSADRGV